MSDRTEESNITLDLIPEAEWEIWYQDTFDADCPRQVELAGHGLVKGLIELWARHLFETVQPNGQLGFSRFNLWWKQRACSITIVGEAAGAARLRQWIFGDTRSTRQGYVQAGDAKLIEAIAAAHSQLVLANQTGEAILAIAATSTSREDFEAQLSRLAIQIKIRVATKDDLEALARLNAQFNDVDTTAAQIAERLADPQCVEIPIVAEVEKQIVGFAGLRVVPQIFYAGAHAELTELFVEEGYRRRGIGQALIQFAERLAQSKGAEEIVIHTGEDNYAAREFYSTMGYEPWDIVVGKTVNRNFECVTMTSHYDRDKESQS
jgi:GNAT superfamily N-acetyltransferase